MRVTQSASGARESGAARCPMASHASQLGTASVMPLVKVNKCLNVMLPLPSAELTPQEGRYRCTRSSRRIVPSWTRRRTTVPLTHFAALATGMAASRPVLLLPAYASSG